MMQRDTDTIVPARTAPRLRTLLAAALIVAAVFIAYWPALHGGFIWDDDSYVTSNRLLHDVNGLRHIWWPGQTAATRTPQYYPVVFTTFWFEYQLWSDHPFGYHFNNLLLHALNALLAWRLCVVIGIPGGWLIAAIFAVHPVHVESVAWITERKNVLSAFFYLTAALAYLHFDRARDGSDQSAGRAWWWYAAALILFTFALLSKTVTCSLPAALILIILYQRTALSAARIAPLLPMFALGLLLALNTAAVERAHVGAEGDEFAFTFAERLIIASRALWFYPWKLIWPHPVMFVYPRWTIDATSWSSYLPALGVGMIAIAAITAFMRGRRGPALALAFYGGTIFPALGFINIYPMRFSFVADHFQYLASLGIITLIGAALSRLGRNALAVIGGVVLAILVPLTFRQAGTYENAETVYRDTLSKNSDAWMPHNNLANILIGRDPVEAERHYRQALRIKPDHFPAQSNLAEALRRQQRYDEAILECTKAIDLVHSAMARRGTTRPPRFLASDYELLGRAYHALGRLPEAEVAYRQSIAIAPESTAPSMLLTRILIQQDRLDEAADILSALLQFNAEDPTARQLLDYIQARRNGVLSPDSSDP